MKSMGRDCSICYAPMAKKSRKKWHRWCLRKLVGRRTK